MNKKKILFLTATRADFGKLKPLMKILEYIDTFDTYIFVTGMHMLSKYGSTVEEVKKEKFTNIYTYINQTESLPMDIILSNTVEGLSNFISEFTPDMIIVHGDRIETLAGAIVGALNNILVAHIEGGELSGTIDELLRHSVSKLAHIHFVANDIAKRRLIQMGEIPENIFEIGSPDLDIMLSGDLPSIENAKKHYEICFDNFAIFSYHPVTTELNSLKMNIKEVIAALVESDRNYVVIYPNNDMGTNIIIEEIGELVKKSNFRVFPSIRFEYFLTLLKHCDFIIGNSSAGIREAEVYNKWAINIGNRQKNRHFSENIINVDEKKDKIIEAINSMMNGKPNCRTAFGHGDSASKFFNIISDANIWRISKQKQFRDVIL